MTPKGEKLLEQDTIVIIPVQELVQDIGPARLGKIIKVTKKEKTNGRTTK
jgi:hypothetical protein